MAKITKKITLTIEIDEADVKPKTPDIILFQILNRINYDHPIRGIDYGGSALNLKDFKNFIDTIKKVDSILPPIKP